MDDGHPAGRGDLAGDEELLLTPVPEPALSKAEVSGVEGLRIFNAWSDEPWVNDGAAVRVSLVCFGAEGRSAAPSAKSGVGLVLSGAEGPADTGTGHDGIARSPRGLGSYQATLNGQPVAAIHADLTGQPQEGDGEAVDLTRADALPENAGVSFQGSQKIGPFDIPGELARSWLGQPNPNQRPNSEVLKPSWNGLDVTRRPRDGWIIDFGTDIREADASLYEIPFQYVVEYVKPEREKNSDPPVRRKWWLHGRPRIEMRAAISGLPRYIATAHVSKHRFFVWMDKAILPDKMLIVIARADDTTFGILHSRFHELWSLRMGTSLEDRPRYTPTTTFETFPFPAGLTPADTRPNPETVGWAKQRVPINDATADPDGSALSHRASLTGTEADGHAALYPSYNLPMLADPSRLPAAEAIAMAAFELNRLREAWLNPPDWVDWVITTEEEQAGFPPRPVAKPGHDADLKKRTLTNLYNARPAWLAMAHERLDQAVAAAYGWEDYTPDMPDEEILKRLMRLNNARKITLWQG